MSDMADASYHRDRLRDFERDINAVVDGGNRGMGATARITGWLIRHPTRCLFCAGITGWAIGAAVVVIWTGGDPEAMRHFGVFG